MSAETITLDIWPGFPVPPAHLPWVRVVGICRGPGGIYARLVCGHSALLRNYLPFQILWAQPCYACMSGVPREGWFRHH